MNLILHIIKLLDIEKLVIIHNVDLYFLKLIQLKV